MVQFTGHFDGKAIVPDEPVAIPSGSLRVSVEPNVVPEEAPEVGHQALLRLIEAIEKDNADLPADMASEHDHYAHGAPKRC